MTGKCGAHRANGEPHQAQGHRNQERASRAYLTSMLAASSEALITTVRQGAAKGCYQQHIAAGQRFWHQSGQCDTASLPRLRLAAVPERSGRINAAEQKAASPLWNQSHAPDRVHFTLATAVPPPWPGTVKGCS